MVEDNYYSKVPGWFDFDNIYEDAVNAAPDGAILVEVGSFMGRSMSFLAEKAFKSGKKLKLFAVDLFCITPDEGDGDGMLPWDGQTAKAWERENGGYDALWNKFNESMKHTVGGDLVTPIRGDSAESASLFEDNSLFFIFIDAGHRYKVVYKDLEAWFPKLQKGGIFAGHDYCGDVARAVNDFSNLKGLNPSRNRSSWII